MELSTEDHEKLARLRRIKRLATGSLMVCFCVFLMARWLEHAMPQWALLFGFLAAFTEAATIGGLADWYAVVVLFKHPMGLKIPHTAIIPSNQKRIAANLGGFLENNFLSQKVVGEKLQTIDFADHIVKWLGDQRRSKELSEFIVRLIPDILSAIDESGFREFGAKRIGKQLLRTEIAPTAEKLIDSFVADGRYQALLDEVLNAVDKIMHDEVTLQTIQKRLADELPTLLYVFQADTVILKRIVKASSTLLDEVREDPQHPLRQEFTSLFESYVDRMKKSRRFARRIERFKTELLARPEITALADNIWHDIADFVAKDSRKKEPVVATQLTGMFVGLARQLQKDENLRAQINQGVTATFAALAADQKSAVSEFVTEEVNRWDFRKLVTTIEANVGRDLQYIRFNGMLIGGIAGLVLHGFDISLLP